MTTALNGAAPRPGDGLTARDALSDASPVLRCQPARPRAGAAGTARGADTELVAGGRGRRPAGRAARHRRAGLAAVAGPASAGAHVVGDDRRPDHVRRALDDGDHSGDASDRCDPGGGGGVSTLPRSVQFNTKHALLGQSNHRELAVHTGERHLGDRTAFVEHQPWAHAAVAEGACDQPGGLAHHLLVGADAQQHRTRRRPAFGHQVLDRLQQHAKCALVVEGAASPDPTVRDPSLERWDGPLGLLTRHRYYVVVRHQHHAG